MRFPGYILLTVFPLLSFAQGSTDCPTWGKKNKTSKAEYFKYLSGSQRKKEVKIVPEKPAPVPVKKTNHTTSTGNKSTTDFYTTRRYNLFPEEKVKEKVVEVEKEEEEVVETPVVEEEIIQAKKEEVTPEEPKIEEVQKASAGEVDSDVESAPEKTNTSKVHKRNKIKIFNKDLKHNAVKKNRRIGGKGRIDRCASKF